MTQTTTIKLRPGTEPVTRQRFCADVPYTGELHRLSPHHTSGYEFALTWWTGFCKREMYLMAEDFDILDPEPQGDPPQ